MGRSDVRRPRGKFGSWPVAAYLLMLAAACSLPIAACAGFLAYHFVSESSRLTKVEYEDRLRLMRNATELRLANIIEDLQILALSPSIADGRFAEFREHAQQTVKLIGGVAIVLYDADGQQLVNTRLDLTGQLPTRVEFDVERKAIETGIPQVSGLQKAVVDGQPIVTVAVPVRIGRQNRFALNIGLSTNYLSSLMDNYVSEGLVGSIVDAKGILLARRPLLDGDELVGKPTIPEVMANIGKPSAWWVKAVSRTGTLTYTSLLRSKQSGWTINLAVPREVIDGPVRQAIEWSVLLAVLTLALGLALARLVANRFMTEFGGLERYVFSLRTDAIEPEMGTITEVNRMKAVMHEVAQELADALDQQKGLLDEINHRVKNTLGTVQSIARLSRASSKNLEEYAGAFEQRLLALSEAYDLLTENNWIGVNLDAIVRRTLAPYAGADRLEIAGPGVLLAPKVALALSAAIQELSANAAKYGAFSTAAGKLRVSWSSGEGDLTRLTWLETGGPPVQKPNRQGFGTRMIVGTFTAEAEWSVEFAFASEGLRCIMAFWPDENRRAGGSVTLAPS